MFYSSEKPKQNALYNRGGYNCNAKYWLYKCGILPTDKLVTLYLPNNNNNNINNNTCLHAFEFNANNTFVKYNTSEIISNSYALVCLILKHTCDIFVLSN